jgi:hypothetical protein
MARQRKAPKAPEPLPEISKAAQAIIEAIMVDFKNRPAGQPAIFERTLVKMASRRTKLDEGTVGPWVSRMMITGHLPKSPAATKDVLTDATELVEQLGGTLPHKDLVEMLVDKGVTEEQAEELAALYKEGGTEAGEFVASL